MTTTSPPRRLFDESHELFRDASACVASEVTPCLATWETAGNLVTAIAMANPARSDLAAITSTAVRRH